MYLLECTGFCKGVWNLEKGKKLNLFVTRLKLIKTHASVMLSINIINLKKVNGPLFIYPI